AARALSRGAWPHGRPVVPAGRGRVAGRRGRMPRGGGKEQSRRAGGASAPGGPRRAAPARLRTRGEGGSSPDVVAAGAALGRPVAMNGTDVAELLGVFALIVL